MDHEADVDPPCGRYWGAWPSSPLQGSHTHPSAEECIRSWLHHLLGIALSWWELLVQCYASLWPIHVIPRPASLPQFGASPGPKLS